MSGATQTAASEDDSELTRVVSEEEACLARVTEHLDGRAPRRSDRPPADYESQMIGLRDEIAAARLEDLPPLIEQMERLQSLAAHRRETTESYVDPKSPYFGRLVLQEGSKRREVLIGRGTYLDTGSDIRIVDWRDAPVSRLYYRYDEGDEYDENFGGREVNGEVLVRRSVSIVDRTLRRVGAPQGTFARTSQGRWRRLDGDALRLHGGQGTAPRAEQHRRPRRLGIGDELLGDDKHLKEITALIDRRQFELITRPDSGLVVIQGGAGSGKTTIALHRLAFLAYRDARRFRADRMLVVVFNQALARYISQVLPALGVNGLAIRTYEAWAERVREVQLPRLPTRYAEDTPSVVTRLKKHPAMLHAIEGHVAALAEKVAGRVREALAQGASPESEAAILGAFARSPERPLAHRIHALSAWSEGPQARALPTDARVALARVLRDGVREARDVVTAWSELVSDQAALEQVLARHAAGEFHRGELARAHAWCSRRASDVAHFAEEREEAAEQAQDDRERDPGTIRDREPRTDGPDDEVRHGVDGREIDEGPALDREDDALLLRLCQRLRGPLMRGIKGKEALVYEHVLVDEAQDLSPVELAVVLGTVSPAQSITLAGDVAQRVLLDNGFSSWKSVLHELGLDHVEVEPLKLSYRSTQQIVDFAQHVLGPLGDDAHPVATRSGLPVDLFVFAHSGDAVGFLGEALRDLMRAEPRASVAVIARFAEQADVYYAGLRQAEVPYLRRIADQDFPFRPGVDVTDVRQVKGLEFDYVVLVEVNESSYPPDDEARHLLHIGATRAAHQLWVVASGTPSPLLPDDLRERGF